MKDPFRLATGKQPEDLWGVGFEFRQINCRAVVIPGQLPGALERGQRPQAKEVNLEHADLIDRLSVELGDDLVFVRRLVERQEVLQRLVGDDDAGGVHARVASQPFQAPAGVDHPTDTLIGFVHLPQFGLTRQGLVYGHL